MANTGSPHLTWEIKVTSILRILCILSLAGSALASWQGCSGSRKGGQQPRYDADPSVGEVAGNVGDGPLAGKDGVSGGADGSGNPTCGTPGMPCCDGNGCGGGACCVSGICMSSGATCAGLGDGICNAGACGGCGGVGLPCCRTSSGSSMCTAPGTSCTTSGTASACTRCGSLGDLCCAGNTCNEGCCSGGRCIVGSCPVVPDAGGQTDAPPLASGGETGSGGRSGSGGTLGTGGMPGTGGKPGSGGGIGAGGVANTGGAIGTGGGTGAGGSASGGTTTTGGRTGTGSGGATGSGGSTGSLPRFFGNLDTNGGIRSDFATYWDQFAPENAGMWSAVQASSSSSFAWAPLDASYKYCTDNNIVFKERSFIWGSGQASWTSRLTTSTGPAAVQNWMKTFCDRYPRTALIDVGSEPPPHTTPGYAGAIGGSGSSGYDWIVNSFKWAHDACPNAILILNDYDNLEIDGGVQHTIDIVNAIVAAGAPIHAVGCETHDAKDLPSSTLKANIDKIASSTGLPIYITEYDLNIADDDQQRVVMQDHVTMFWSDSNVKGITYYGYISGATWRTNTGLMQSSGTMRPAMSWLMDFLGR